MIEIGKNAFTHDGRVVYVKDVVGDKAVINKVHLVYYYGADHEAVEELDDQDVLVDLDSLLERAPVDKYDVELQSVMDKIEARKVEANSLANELSRLKREIRQVQDTQISESKFVINLSHLRSAKHIVFFAKDHVMPHTVMEGDKWYRGVKISVEAEISYGTPTMRSWGYKIWKDNAYNSSIYLCEKYGFLCDPTQEEVDATIVKRLDELKFGDAAVASVPDELLLRSAHADVLLDRKKKFEEESQKNEEDRLRRQIAEAQEKLQQLTVNLDKIINKQD